MNSNALYALFSLQNTLYKLLIRNDLKRIKTQQKRGIYYVKAYSEFLQKLP